MEAFNLYTCLSSTTSLDYEAIPLVRLMLSTERKKSIYLSRSREIKYRSFSLLPCAFLTLQ